MEQTLYILLLLIALFSVCIELFYKQDKDIQIIFTIPAFVLFIVLAFLSFDIEYAAYDSTGVWHTTSTVEYAYALYNFMMTVISSIYGFVLIMERWKEVTVKSAAGL